MFQGVDNGGIEFQQTKSRKLDPNRNAVLDLEEYRSRKVGRQCRLTDAGQAVQHDDRRQ